MVYPDEKHNQEWITTIRKGEHYLITLLQRIKYPSKGFILALEFELLKLRNKYKVEDLDKTEEKK